jgi:hypothetical protein
MFTDTVSLEFIGGSQDGAVIEASGAPEYLKMSAGDGWMEIYERQNDEAPFVYVQVGYVPVEIWS